MKRSRGQKRGIRQNHGSQLQPTDQRQAGLRGGARQSLGSTDACREYAPTGTYCTHNHTHTGDRNRSSQGAACHAADRLTGNYISGSHPPPPLPTPDSHGDGRRGTTRNETRFLVSAFPRTSGGARPDGPSAGFCVCTNGSGTQCTVSIIISFQSCPAK